MNKPRQADEQYIRVYVARYPFDTLSSFVPSPRREEIDACKADEVAQSKYYVFKLLEIALRDVYGVTLDGCNLTRGKNGNWTCDVCRLSFSHSGDVVAIALSNMPVGIDVEHVDVKRFDNRLQMRIFTDNEKAAALTMTETERALYANRLWTAKEAEFKRYNGQRFVPSDIDTTALNFSTATCQADGKPLYVTVAAKDLSGLKYYATNVKISGK